MSAAQESPELVVADQAAWSRWLEAHATSSDGVRLVLAKKGVEDPTSLTYAQALDEALCHGWVDGVRNRRDESSFLQRFTPRRRRSIWSQRNVDHVARLVAEGRMRPGGTAEVERARADGRWDAAYPGQADSTVPEDLAAALAANPAAAAMFETLSGQNRYAVLHRTGQAKRADTRARRIAGFVDMLARGETIHPQPTRPPGGT